MEGTVTSGARKSRRAVLLRPSQKPTSRAVVAMPSPNRTRQVWIAITAFDRTISLREGEEVNWPLSPRGGKTGDVFLVYRTMRGLHSIKARAAAGIYQVFEITDPSHPKGCRIRLVRSLHNTVQFSDLKSDPVLRNIRGVSGNFQAHLFYRVGEHEWRRLKELIETRP